MQLITPPPSVVPCGLAAMVAVARAASGGMSDTHRTLLDTMQRLVLHSDLDLETLPEVEPATLARYVGEPALARQLVRGMIVMSLAVGPATPRQMELIAGFARELAVEEPAVKAIQHLARQHKLRFLLDLHRRSNLRDYVDNQYAHQGGIVAVAEGLLEFKGLLHDDALAARFGALGELPEGTLGHAFFRHYRDHGFAFPGQKGGFPVGALFHDFGHVIAGYDVTPEGELQIACFQAGYRRTEDAFFTILFAVLIHTAGINVAPIPMPKHPGRIGEGKLFERMLHALERGSQMTTDLGDDWDFWSWVELPLAETRRRMGVPPPRPEFATGPGVYGPPIGVW